MTFERFIIRAEDIAGIEGVSLRSGQRRLSEIRKMFNLPKGHTLNFMHYTKFHGWTLEELIEFQEAMQHMKQKKQANNG